MDKAERIRNEKLGAGLIKALALRHFDAYYCASCAEAAEKILSLIPKTDVIYLHQSLFFSFLFSTSTK